MENGGLIVVPNVPGDARGLKNERDFVFGILHEEVGIKQGDFHFFFAVAPLPHHFLKWEENFVATPEQQVADFLFLAAFGVEDVPVL